MSKHSIEVPDKFDTIKAVTENILNILVDSPRNQLFEEPVFIKELYFINRLLN